MAMETVVQGAQGVSPERTRGPGLGIAIVLLAAGLVAGAGSAVHPRLAATFGAAVLLSGSVVAALRGRRLGTPPSAAVAPGESRLVRGMSAALAAPDARAALRALSEALAATLAAGVALEGVAGVVGSAPTLIVLPEGHPGSGAGPERAGEARGSVPPSMRVSEPCVLAGATARDAGGLPGALHANTALTVPIRLRGGELVGWLAAARPGEWARPFTSEDLALAGSAAAVAGAVLEEARLRGEAQAGLQARSEFLAVMSHELKTPLNVVVGYADLLLMGLPEAVPEGARRTIERLRRSARELQERIEEILGYVRLGNGMETPDEEPVEVDAGAALRAAAADLEPVARAKGLDYVVRTPPDALRLRTYPEALGHMLRLVLANAVKFTYGGGVEAELTASAGGATVRISDTGIGIAADQIAHVFEPFWQANRGATRREGGLGLGLTTARALARALGGDIRLESAPGSGTTVTITVANRP